MYKTDVDTCNICNSNTITEEEKKIHKRDAYKACQAMKNDQNFFFFDLQKAHTITVLNTSTAYCKHHLILYNERIHDRDNLMKVTNICGAKTLVGEATVKLPLYCSHL